MFRITPTPKNTYAKTLCTVCLFLGAALFVFAGTDGVDFPILPQFLGMISLTVSIYIASLYLLRQYTFSIDLNPASENNELDLVILEHKGKREITVCRIGIGDIVSVREVSAQNKKQVMAERKKLKCYTYDTSFIAPRRIEVNCHLGDEDFSILITYDEQLLMSLKRYI